MGFLERTEKLIGSDAVHRIQQAAILVAGVGGVGSYCAEALARSGIGCLYLIDDDVIDESNLNRQIHALRSTLGRYKVDVMSQRLHDINPEIKCVVSKERIGDTFSWPKHLDYIVDCVDDIRAKVALIRYAKVHHIPVISSMGTGNHIDNLHFVVTDISKTKICPLARKLRKELRAEAICQDVKVCYVEASPYKKTEGSPGTLCHVPATGGLTIAGTVLRDLFAE